MPIPPIPKPPCLCRHGEAAHWSEVPIKGKPGAHRLKRGACGGLRGHGADSLGSCGCRKYEPQQKRGTRRGIRQRSQRFEREIAAAFHGVRRGGVGQEDVIVYRPDGTIGLSIECEESARVKMPKWATEKLAQSARLAAQRGAPIHLFVSNEKAGRGHPTAIYVTLLLDHAVRWAEEAFSE